MPLPKPHTTHYAPPRPGRPPRVDLYLPESGGSGRSVLLVHGGGFVGGWRSMPAMRTCAHGLLASGFAVAALDYRLLFRGGRFQTSLDDVVTGLDWWREQAPTRGLDPARISVMGLSAGAALAAVAGSLRPVEALVLVYGPHDFTQLTIPLAARALLGTSDARVWRDQSPARRCTTPSPVLLAHGTADGLVPIAHSERLLAHRDQRGLPTTLLRYEGAGHGFLNWPSLEISQQVAHDVLAWLADPSISR